MRGGRPWRPGVLGADPVMAAVSRLREFHGVPLYNAVYRFDDQMLVTPAVRG